jgi:hypothetical protein
MTDNLNQTGHYIVGFGLAYDHFLHLVDPLPESLGEKMVKDVKGKSKYSFNSDYISENLDGKLYDLVENLFKVDYEKNLRRDYRNKNGYPEYRPSDFKNGNEDFFVEEEMKKYKLTRTIPDCFKNIDAGFVRSNIFETNVRVAIGIEIEDLSEHYNKVCNFAEYYDELLYFFELHEATPYVCPAIYNVD